MFNPKQSAEPLLHKNGGTEPDLDTDGDLIENRKRQPSIFYQHFYVYSLFVFLLGAVAYALTSKTLASVILKPGNNDVSLGLDPPLPPGQEAVENGYFCGHTPEEARRNGCHFDLILYTWVPAACYDEGVQAAYRERNFQWFTERAGINEISQERAAQGVEKELWLNWDYHIWHCRHTFIQMTRILLNTSLGIPGRLIDPEHSQHCLNTLTGDQWEPLDNINTIVTLNYSTCYSRK